MSADLNNLLRNHLRNGVVALDEAKLLQREFIRDNQRRDPFRIERSVQQTVMLHFWFVTPPECLLMSAGAVDAVCESKPLKSFEVPTSAGITTLSKRP